MNAHASLIARMTGGACLHRSFSVTVCLVSVWETGSAGVTSKRKSPLSYPPAFGLEKEKKILLEPPGLSAPLGLQTLQDLPRPPTPTRVVVARGAASRALARPAPAPGPARRHTRLAQASHRPRTGLAQASHRPRTPTGACPSQPARAPTRAPSPRECSLVPFQPGPAPHGCASVTGGTARRPVRRLAQGHTVNDQKGAQRRRTVHPRARRALAGARSCRSTPL